MALIADAAVSVLASGFVSVLGSVRVSVSVAPVLVSVLVSMLLSVLVSVLVSVLEWLLAIMVDSTSGDTVCDCSPVVSSLLVLMVSDNDTSDGCDSNSELSSSDLKNKSINNNGMQYIITDWLNNKSQFYFLLCFRSCSWSV